MQSSRPLRAEVSRDELIKAYEQLKKDRSKEKLKTNRPQKCPKETKSAKYQKFVKAHGRTLSPGSAMSDTVAKLADESLFTGVYKQRLLERDNKIEDFNCTGDLCSSPKRARQLLKSTPVSKLNTPGRSADYKMEVEWRLQLRPNLN